MFGRGTIEFRGAVAKLVPVVPKRLPSKRKKVVKHKTHMLGRAAARAVQAANAARRHASFSNLNRKATSKRQASAAKRVRAAAVASTAEAANTRNTLPVCTPMFRMPRLLATPDLLSSSSIQPLLKTRVPAPT